MNKIIEVKNIHKRIGKKQILKDVSLSVEEGQILGFIGPNGAGKTTAIKLILGLQSINKGEVLINGYSIKKDFEKAIERVGAIVESPDLYMYLSGLENLKIIAKLYNINDENRISEIVKLVGLEKRIKDKVSKYSLGMRQRLGIAAALINKPNVLILDEPTNGLDPEGIKELRDLLKNLAKKEKMGILISSHNLAELESFISDVCLIQNGQILSIMPIEEIKKASHSSYIFEVDNISSFPETKYEQTIIDDAHIKIYCEKENIPNLIEELINHNIKIYEVKSYKRSLEEAFIEETGGNTIE